MERCLLAAPATWDQPCCPAGSNRGLDPKQMIVQDPSPPEARQRADQKAWHRLRASVGPLREAPAVLVVAVKPQVMDQVFPPLAQLAGRVRSSCPWRRAARIEGFERHLSKGASVVRCIPNTPSSIGRGITGRSVMRM
jgi:pyrroline-5-carboxylate reductase